MGINNKRIVLLDFNAFEVTSIEYYLEEMAKKGWILEKISNIYAKFKKDEPRKIKYNIDIVYGSGAFEFLYEDESKENIEKQENKGWNFLCDFQKMQVFYKEYEKEEISNETIERSKEKEIYRYSLYEIITRVIPIFLLGLIQYSSLSSRRSLDFLTDNGKIFGRIIIIIFLLVFFIDSMKLFKFKISPKDISSSIRWIKLKSLIMMSLILVFLLSIIFPIIRLSSIDDTIGIKFVMGLILIGALVSFIYYLVNINKNFKKNTIIASLLILIVSGVLIISNFIFDNSPSNINKSLNNKEYSLSLKDFNDELITDEDLFVDESSSFLASKIFYSAYGNKIKLSYELFESDHEWITKLNFDKMMKWFEKQDIKYREIETNLPEDIKVLVNEEGSNYFLVSSKKMIELIGVEDIEDKEDFFNTVYEKIFI